MRPRRYRMKPALCSSCAAMVTVVRRTPSISPRKFLRQRDGIAVDAVVRLQEPAAKPGLHRMQRIARDRLLHLRQQQIVIAHDEIANGLAPIRSGMKLESGEPRRRARQLPDHSPAPVLSPDAPP